RSWLLLPGSAPSRLTSARTRWQKRSRATGRSSRNSLQSDSRISRPIGDPPHRPNTSQARPAEAMEMAQAHMHQPDLRIGNALPQPVGRLHLILVQFVLARFDVDGDKLVLVGRRQVGAHLAGDERVAAAGELFFAIAPSGAGHAFPPGSTPRP